MNSIQVTELIKRNIQKDIAFNAKYSIFDKSSILKHAHRLFKEGAYTFGECWSRSWDSAKRIVLNSRKALNTAQNRLMDMYTPKQNTSLKVDAFVKFIVTTENK